MDKFFSQSEKMLKIKYYIDRKMSLVHQSVLDQQLEIVNMKMRTIRARDISGKLMKKLIALDLISSDIKVKHK